MRHEIIERALAEGAGSDADAQALATACVRAVSQLLNELRPLVGELATTALYRRSLHLAKASVQRPEAGPAQAQTPDQLLAPLLNDLAARPVADAQRAARSLVTSLVDLLMSLIGEPLTHQMLKKAWGVADDSSGPEEKPQ